MENNDWLKSLIAQEQEELKKSQFPAQYVLGVPYPVVDIDKSKYKPETDQGIY